MHYGGLMVYATDLSKEQLKMGHNVIMLMPGIYNGKGKSKIKFFKVQEKLPVYQIINSHPVNLSGIGNPSDFIKEKKENNYRDFLKKNNIEILHVHSLMGFPKELLDEAKNLGIKTIFSAHDYFGLCPKYRLFKYDGTLCNDFNEGKSCVLCNYEASNRAIKSRNLLIVFPLGYRILRKTYQLFKRSSRQSKKEYAEKKYYQKLVFNKNKAIKFVEFRRYYIKILESFDFIIFNSSVTKNEFSKYINLNKLTYKILPVTHSSIKDNRNVINYKPLINGKVNFLFMGGLVKGKGFYDLVNILNEIKKTHTNWQINIYGNYSGINLDNFDNNFFKFYGKYSYKDLIYIFSNSSILIIPSKWKETFGLIGLEAFSYGIPVISSENVGFSDLVEDGKTGFIYKEDSENEHLKKIIIAILENPYLLQEMNKEIKRIGFKYTLKHHVNEIIVCYKNLLEEKL
ncbi:glycosyltransferase [Thermosipho atlanticus]|nr:glycosyltransferase [Thermosipho atlanticus]